MKTKLVVLGILIAGMVLTDPCTCQERSDSLIAAKAFRALRKANAVNAVSIVFGLASNIEMIAIGGFPLEVDEGVNPGLNISHVCIASIRLATLIGPPVEVSKARKILRPWSESPEMAASCTRLFANLDAAQVLSGLAPLLCVSGGVMMVVASTHRTEYGDPDYYTDHGAYKSSTSMPALKYTGWVLVGAGFAASLSSAILIGISKQELSRKMGSFTLKANPTGVGLQYNLPVKQ